MIYTTQGVMQRQYTQVNGNDWQHLVNSVKNPPSLNELTANQLDTYKHTDAPYVVYGTSTGLERGTSEITSRSILFIDVDDAGETYEKRSYAINVFLSQFGINHAIYPTINNGIKPSERLRVGIPLDVELSQEDYSKVWQVLTQSMHLNADPAGASKAFKQLQGLYVWTTQNTHNQPIIETNGKPLNTEFFLSKYVGQQSKTSTQTTPNTVTTTTNVPRWAMNNRKIIRAIVDPENTYQEFNGWDNMLTSIGGWVFKSTQGDIELSATVVQSTNDKGTDPLPFDELKKKFHSWMKYWRY